MRLFEELDVLDNIPGATVRSLKDVYHLSKQPASTKAGDASQCPFIAKQNDTASAMGAASVAVNKHGVCPWPFILLHNPATGMKKWQTWLVIGLVLAVVYQNVV
jgi:hypothetical protein